MLLVTGWPRPAAPASPMESSSANPRGPRGSCSTGDARPCVRVAGLPIGQVPAAGCAGCRGQGASPDFRRLELKNPPLCSAGRRLPRSHGFSAHRALHGEPGNRGGVQGPTCGLVRRQRGRLSSRHSLDACRPLRHGLRGACTFIMQLRCSLHSSFVPCCRSELESVSGRRRHIQRPCARGHRVGGGSSQSSPYRYSLLSRAGCWAPPDPRRPVALPSVDLHGKRTPDRTLRVWNSGRGLRD